MSKKPKKETKPGKAANKPSAKAKPAGKSSKSTVETKPYVPEPPSRPMVASNTEGRGTSRSLVALLLVTILVGGGFATQPLWAPYVIDYLPGLKNPVQLEPPEDTFVDRLNEIEKEVDRVRQSGEAIADLERERGALNQSFQGVMARIGELEKQIDYVRGMLQATAPPSDALETNESLLRLSLRMNKLEASDKTVNVVMERLARLEKAMADSGSNADSSAEQLSKTMAGISQRIGSLESGIAQSSAGEAQATARTKKQVQAQTLVLAVGHLRETLRSSAPFVPALGALEALAHGDTDIMRGVNELAPYAQTGIATMDTLRREFTAAAQAIARATVKEGQAGSSEDVVSGILSKMKSLVSVRKAGSMTPLDASGGLTQKARERLAEGDLGGAIESLSDLSGPQGSAADPWLERARARLIAETALSRMHVFVVSLLAPINK